MRFNIGYPLTIISNPLNQDLLKRKEIEARKQKRLEAAAAAHQQAKTEGATKRAAFRRKPSAPGGAEDPCILDQLLSDIGRGHFKRRTRQTRDKSFKEAEAILLS